MFVEIKSYRKGIQVPNNSPRDFSVWFSDLTDKFHVVDPAGKTIYQFDDNIGAEQHARWQSELRATET